MHAWKIEPHAQSFYYEDCFKLKQKIDAVIKIFVRNTAYCIVSIVYFRSNNITPPFGVENICFSDSISSVFNYYNLCNLSVDIYVSLGWVIAGNHRKEAKIERKLMTLCDKISYLV